MTGEMRARECPVRRWPTTLTVTALTITAVLLWGAAISTFWVNLKDGDPAVITGMATTASVLAYATWKQHSDRERDQRREDAHLGTIEMLTRPAAVHLTGPQPSIGRGFRLVK